MPTLKINQPDKLDENCRNEEFKPWWNQVLSYLDQDENMEQFLPGGRYENWTAKSATPRGIRGRLTTLFEREDDSPEHHKSDVDFTVAEVRAVALKNDPTIENQRDSYAMDDQGKEEIKNGLKVIRLAERNRMLDKMLAIVASMVHRIDMDDIRDDSTSMEWINKYLQRRFNIETKGVNFLKIANNNYTAGTNHQIFYKQFRSAFVDNLRKAGDSSHHLRPGATLEQDEVMTPKLRGRHRALGFGEN